MNRRLWIGVGALCAFAPLGGKAVRERWQSALSAVARSQAVPEAAPETPLPVLALPTPVGERDSSAVPDPFGALPAPRPIAGGGDHGLDVRERLAADHAAPETPFPWKLTGVVGGRAAVLSGPGGRGVVLSVGDTLAGRSLLSVERDRALFVGRGGGPLELVAR